MLPRIGVAPVHRPGAQALLGGRVILDLKAGPGLAEIDVGGLGLDDDAAKQNECNARYLIGTLWFGQWFKLFGRYRRFERKWGLILTAVGWRAWFRYAQPSEIDDKILEAFDRDRVFSFDCGIFHA